MNLFPGRHISHRVPRLLSAPNGNLKRESRFSDWQNCRSQSVLPDAQSPGNQQPGEANALGSTSVWGEGAASVGVWV